MLMKQDHATSSSATVCSNCGAKERRLLHHVRHRTNIFRRVCTTCVLRLHPQSFCPTCFQVYPPTPPHDSVITCFKCYSSSHSHCVTAHSSGSNYICPLCVNPNSQIFSLKTATEANVRIRDREGLDAGVNSDVYRVIDQNSAKILLAATKIATGALTKWAVASRSEAERRAKEAAFTRKRAKEALEHVAYLVVREKVRKKEVALSKAPEVSGPSGGQHVAHLVGRGNMGHLGGGIVQVTREHGTNINNSSGSSRSENMDGGVRPVLDVAEKASTMINVDRVDSSTQVLAALDAVELRENEKITGLKAVDGVSGKLPNDNCVLMDVDHNKGGMRMSSGSRDGHGELVEKNSVGRSETSADLGCVSEDQSIQAQRMVVLVPPSEDQRQNEENSIGGLHGNGAQQ